jgi:hypothetical protein
MCILSASLTWLCKWSWCMEWCRLQLTVPEKAGGDSVISAGCCCHKHSSFVLDWRDGLLSGIVLIARQQASSLQVYGRLRAWVSGVSRPMDQGSEDRTANLCLHCRPVLNCLAKVECSLLWITGSML